MYRYLPLLFTVVLIPGCGVVLDLLGVSGPFGRETGSPELKRFASEQEMTDYFAEQMAARNDRFVDVGFLGAPVEGPLEALGGDDAAGSPPMAEPGLPGATEGGDAGSLETDFSQTTIQEEGVDEADVVKTDGTHLYVIDGGLLRIVRVFPPEQLASLGEVPLDGYGREIYLHDGKVVALTETGGGFYYLGGGGTVVEPVPATDTDGAVTSDVATSEVDTGLVEPGIDGELRYERPRTVVTVIDASTPEDPRVLSETRFDGLQSASRMIDGVLHLVISNYQAYYSDVLPLLGQPELDVSEVDAEALLPAYERVGGGEVVSDGPVLTWRELYRPTDPDGFGMVSAVSLDVDNDAEFTAVGIVAEPGLIYSSLNALYLTDTEFNFAGDTRETTDIYKLAYVDRGAVPVATGSVPGRILNQYSMGEYEGYLRVATTVSATFSFFGQRDGPFNNVYVLTESEGTLDVVGSVLNIEPGETIQAARFIGNRGYLVTFEQIDPLVTLDLSEAANPRVVGKLEVPGFSTFIVPIDTDHLLTVGQYVPPPGEFGSWGVQLSIFDVSDFGAPQRTANVILGEETGASSEALYNPKAFTYFAERGLVALPVSISEYPRSLGGGPVEFTFIDDGSDDPDAAIADETVAPAPDEPIDLIEPVVPQGFEGLVVYSVSVEEGLSELGRISTHFDEAGYYWSSFTRGVFIGDDVFAVTNHGVRGGPVSDLTGLPYELLFER